ncbi:MAG: aminotransferase class V-fold PLP-dependent enzyme [Clostridia bacterium]|nr:aminotransferase class V-fold PLP-dependent enzyme [Clostridia bacterium]
MRNIVYLDNAATTFPKPETVLRTMNECMRQYGGNPGRSSHRLSLRAAEKIFECREEVATLFDAPSPESVMFTYNTTYALNMAIKAHLIYGSHVLISDMEHNSVLRPIDEAARRGYCTYDIFTSAGDSAAVMEAIRQKTRLNTRMLVCNHASNVGGRVLPLKMIGQYCRARGICFIVDGAQSAGTIPISLKEMQIDALCVPGHKGLYGPQGVGIMVLGTERLGRTFIEGGNGIRSLEREMPDFLPERYEAGTLATPCIAGLCEGIKWLKQRGIRTVSEEEKKLSFIAQKWLEKNPEVILYPMGENITGTFCFNLRHMPSQAVAESLDAKGICVRPGFHCSPLAHKGLQTGEYGAVRVNIGAFNNLADINALAEAVEEISRK